MSTKLLGALLLFSVSANVIMGFSIYDSASASNDLGVSLETREGELALSVKMINAILKRPDQFHGPIDNAASSAEKLFPDKLVKEEGDTLWIDSIGIRYAGDTPAEFFLMNPTHP